MPLVHRILVTLRTLMEDDPQPSYRKIRKPNGANRTSQTTAMVLTFRDLFLSGGLDVILDEMDVGRRTSRRNSRTHSDSNRTSTCCVQRAVPCPTGQPRQDIGSNTNTCCVQRALPCSTGQPTQDIGNRTNTCCVQRAVPCSTVQPRQDIEWATPILRDQVPAPRRLIYEDETVPLLAEDATIVPCTDLVVSPILFHPGGLFDNLAFRHKKPESLTVALNPCDERKTVETLRKVLKWSPRKQNSATFAVSLPVQEKHSALAVVENAVNTVKEEQLSRRKKRRKFFWLKFC